MLCRPINLTSKSLLTGLLLALMCCADMSLAESGHATDSLSSVHSHLTRPLAERVAPNVEGAMGRNRSGYFHVRFQMGLHHWVDHGLASHDPKAILKFVQAAEYALKHQLPNGDFQLIPPPRLAGKGQASSSDRASGVAFFIYSLGVGLHALQHSAWWQACERCDLLRPRLKAITQQLPASLEYLLAQQERLLAVDRQAPNRLLFNSLAFHGLSQLLGSQAAAEAADRFLQLAKGQAHAAGYFIEGGGYDSSYNGVATALCFRLLLMEYPDPTLTVVCDRALAWQVARILPRGEIDTTGNSRVRSDGTGEAFLGRVKDVDAAHTIEALMLASVLFPDRGYRAQAAQVLAHYRAVR